jgi:hypothetical protein
MKTCSVPPRMPVSRPCRIRLFRQTRSSWEPRKSCSRSQDREGHGTRRKAHTVGDRNETHIFLHIDSGSVGQKLDEIITQLSVITTQVQNMDAATQAKLDALNTAVAANTTVEQSVETLLTGLAAQIASLKTGVTDPAVLAAIDSATAIVSANNAKFADAVTANTPAA